MTDSCKGDDCDDIDYRYHKKFSGEDWWPVRRMWNSHFLRKFNVLSAMASWYLLCFQLKRMRRITIVSQFIKFVLQIQFWKSLCSKLGLRRNGHRKQEFHITWTYFLRPRQRPDATINTLIRRQWCVTTYAGKVMNRSTKFCAAGLIFKWYWWIISYCWSGRTHFTNKWNMFTRLIGIKSKATSPKCGTVVKCACHSD